MGFKQKLKGFWLELKGLISIFLSIAFIILMWQWFGGWGILGALIAIILILLIRGYKHRWIYLQQVREMETVMFGKSLDKGNWKKGELKEIKLKPVWRKGK